LAGLLWEWHYYIAPAPIIEKQDPYTENPRSFRHWGLYKTKKTFKSFRHPNAGDVLDIPDYGPCKVERVIHWSRLPSRNYTLAVVISPKSHGNEDWWIQNKNHPVAKHGANWTLEFELPKRHFSDLEIPENGYVES
jgi:hypothetical protein